MVNEKRGLRISQSLLSKCQTVFVGTKMGTFLLSPPPHQKIRKTVEIVPEKMKKSSIEILQILVLSKYN